MQIETYTKKWIKEVKLPGYKLTKDMDIEIAPVPDEVRIPLDQHCGCPCVPSVKKGQTVKRDQEIAHSPHEPRSHIHASISGRIKKVTDNEIHIKSDGKLNSMPSSIIPVDMINKDQLIDMIDKAGIIGMGGAGFPTYCKYKSSKKLLTLIINGAECEPYLTCDDIIMQQYSAELVRTICAMIRIFNFDRAIFAIKHDKPEAIKAIAQEIRPKDKITILSLNKNYPIGEEHLLIRTILGVQITKDKYPTEYGIVVNNVSTIKAIHDCMFLDEPVTTRVVTVTGDIKKPKNLLVRIGTKMSDVIEWCKGFTGDPKKIIIGGPMTGKTITDLSTPVTKTTSSIIIVNQPQDLSSLGNCVHCGRCVDVCPMNLMPLELAKSGLKSLKENAVRHHVELCIECGCCSFICPMKIPITHYIALAKKLVSDSEVCRQYG
jgi:electron transport complex protein RnfC